MANVDSLNSNSTAPTPPTTSSTAQAAAAGQQVAEAGLADARRRQITLHDTTNAVLAYLVTVMFASVLISLIFFGKYIETPGKEILFTLLGVLGTQWANIIGFYFGSSASSQQKSQTISSALAQQTAHSNSNPTPQTQ